MAKINFIFKKFMYYIIGMISFSTIAFFTQRVIVAILLETSINPKQDLFNIKYYILSYGIIYLIVYTLIYFIIIYSVKQYNKYIMNKLNMKLEQVKMYQKKIDKRGDNNV